MMVVAAAADRSGPADRTRVVAHPEWEGWAERIPVPVNWVAPLPDTVSFEQAATRGAQKTRVPGFTSESGRSRMTSPWSSGTPRTSTSDMKVAIWRGGKLVTATTSRPTSSSGV